MSSDNGEWTKPYYTLEPAWVDPPTDVKPRAIPPGRYRVAVRWSEKHKMTVPWVVDVPGFEAIEIHPGNYPSDTLGCLLVGEDRRLSGSKSMIMYSRHAWSAIFSSIISALHNHQEVWIEYVNGWPTT